MATQRATNLRNAILILSKIQVRIFVKTAIPVLKKADPGRPEKRYSRLVESALIHEIMKSFLRLARSRFGTGSVVSATETGDIHIQTGHDQAF